MSYILEALRKSDRQRQVGRVPDLQTPQAILNAPVDRAGYWWSHPWLLAAALVVAVLFGFFVWLELQPLGMSGARTVPSGSAADEQSGPVRAQVVLRELPARDTVQTAPGQPTGAMAGLEELAGIEIQLEEPERVAAATAVLPLPAASVTAPLTKPVVEPAALSGQALPEAENPFDRERVQPSRDVGSQPPSRQVAIAAPPPRQRPASAGAAAEESNVIYWRQLPISVQRSLPELNFSVHIYSEQPGGRMVKINGRMMREGQRVTPSLKLEAITPKGVIFGYKEYQFSMNVI